MPTWCWAISTRNYFLGGRMKLDLEGARRAIQDTDRRQSRRCRSKRRRGAFTKMANENMANAARVHTLERGKDPPRLPLFAFGGAGPGACLSRGAGTGLARA